MPKYRPFHRNAFAVGLISLGIAALPDGRPARAAEPDEPSRDEVMQELRALREQVRRLEERQAETDNRPSREAVDATVDGVLRDADRRSQVLQAQGFTAGWTKGRFVIQSEDGNFLLNPQLWLQARYVANYREEDAANEVDGDAATDEGFEMRRAILLFEGNVFTPNLKYRFRFNTNRSNGTAFIEDAYVNYRVNDALGVRLGQYKEPTFHEEAMADVRQLAAERSLINFALGGGVTDRVQGVALWYDRGPDTSLRGEAGFTDGPNSKNTNFVDGGGNALHGQVDPDFGVYGRGEYKVFGDWKNYDDFTALGTTEDLLVAGGGASYSQAGDNNLLLHTLDAHYEKGPFGAYAAYYGAYSDQNDAGSLYDAGLELQASYLLTPKWEVFGRYEYIDLDDDRGPGADDDYHVIAAGVNYYVHGHAAKFTLDLSYLPNGSPVNFDGGGILDPDADAEQFVARGQFQLLL